VSARLLPLLAATGPQRRAAFLVLDEERLLLNRCWSVDPDGAVEKLTVSIDPQHLLTDAPAGGGWARLRKRAELRARQSIPGLEHFPGGIWIAALQEGERLEGLLLIADAVRFKPWHGRPGRDPLLYRFIELFRGELSAERARVRGWQGLTERLGEAEDETRTLRERIGNLARELARAQRVEAMTKPRIDALEQAQGKATELLVDSHLSLARREETLRRLQQVFAGLREILERNAPGVSPRELASELVHVVSATFEGSRCSLLLYEPSARGPEHLRLAAALGLPAGVDPAGVRVRVGEGIAGWVALQGAELIVRAPEDAERLPVRASRGYTGPVFVSFPLTYHGRFAGVLNLTNFRAGTVDDVELEALRLVMLALALVVDHARLNERLFALEPA
jgi:hypothetical protein